MMKLKLKLKNPSVVSISL